MFLLFQPLTKPPNDLLNSHTNKQSESSAPLHIRKQNWQSEAQPSPAVMNPWEHPRLEETSLRHCRRSSRLFNGPEDQFVPISLLSDGQTDDGSLTCLLLSVRSPFFSPCLFVQQHTPHIIHCFIYSDEKVYRVLSFLLPSFLPPSSFFISLIGKALPGSKKGRGNAKI